MFIDASALVAIILRELEAEAFVDQIEASPVTMTSPIAVYEAVLAVRRVSNASISVAKGQINAFMVAAGVRLIQTGLAEVDAALDAHDRFGKGRHPARLNMGDCFAYACARTQNAPLLFKGDDFALTDAVAA